MNVKGVYDNLHLLSCTHISQFIAINLIDGIDGIDLIDFYNFKDTILKNYLTNFNESFYINFQVIINFNKNVGI